MEIKVGDYVRTKDGCIFKATDYWIYDCEVKTENIVSHSKNIIDLIEEGDYVDGIKVKEIYCGEKYEGLGVEKFGKYLLLNEIKFKSIVTKEQFSSLEYII